jgi:hypothetical protein
LQRKTKWKQKIPKLKFLFLNLKEKVGKVEGYWAISPKKTEEFPFPVRHDWVGKDLFLVKLKEKEKTAKVTHYRGFSDCRLDSFDKCTVGEFNGAKEYSEPLRPKNGCFVWSGCYHYVSVHNVIPSKKFYDFIMN